MRDFTLYDIFVRNARMAGPQTGLAGGDVNMSFSRLLEQIDSLAAGLTRKGLGKGDRIAILANNYPDYLYVYGAAAAMGAIVVPINWRLAEEEIAFILADCIPKIMVTDHHHEAKARDLAAGCDSIDHVLGMASSCQHVPALDGWLSAEKIPVSDITQDDPYCIIYTAAVEGKPRGAVLSHGNMIYSNIQTVATMQLTAQDAFLNMLPLFHITGLNLAFSVMHAGGKNVIMERFDPAAVLQQVEIEKISVLGSFPPILSKLMEAKQAGPYDTTSLRHVLGIDSPDTITQFEETFDSRFWVLYGQTETSGFVTLSPFAEKPGSAGRQGLLIRMKLVDDEEGEVAVGAKGEIVVRGPLVFQGFWQQEATNRETFRQGWHHTGDLGRLDEDGYLWFEGRKPEKELIKPGGENVYPAEVETVIQEHSAIMEVSVIGVPDPKFGEGIKAVCVLKEKDAITADDLMEFVAQRIARYKKPRYVQFVEKLPKTQDGAIDRDAVKKEYGQQA
jgi:acyl-CoA synthetase (AMP-forming)/AMP-acid ligase II